MDLELVHLGVWALGIQVAASTDCRHWVVSSQLREHPLLGCGGHFCCACYGASSHGIYTMGRTLSVERKVLLRIKRCMPARLFALPWSHRKISARGVS